MDYLAVTLARSGSKAIPNKNILKINDIAISHYPIKAANDSKYISTLIYSSDSEEYLELAQKFFRKCIQQHKFATASSFKKIPSMMPLHGMP